MKDTIKPKAINGKCVTFKEGVNEAYEEGNLKE